MSDSYVFDPEVKSASSSEVLSLYPTLSCVAALRGQVEKVPEGSWAAPHTCRAPVSPCRVTPPRSMSLRNTVQTAGFHHCTSKTASPQLLPGTRAYPCFTSPGQNPTWWECTVLSGTQGPISRCGRDFALCTAQGKLVQVCQPRASCGE